MGEVIKVKRATFRSLVTLRNVLPKLGILTYKYTVQKKKKKSLNNLKC